MTQAKKYIEKAFWLLLVISPALDIINGMWAYALSGGRGQMLSTLHLADLPGMSPSLTLRMLFLVLMTVYVFLLKKWRSVIMFLSIGVTWILTVAGELLRHVEFSLSADIQYIVRFCYCLLVLIVYSTMLKEDGRSREELKTAVDKVLTYSLFTLSLGVLLPYLFGMGFYTYSDRMGYRGNRGFFYAGNDITAVMMLLLPVVLACWLQSKEIKKPGLAWMQAAASICCFISMTIIGTKTAFLAAGAIAVVMAVYSLACSLRDKKWDMLIRVAVVAVLVPMLMFVLSAGGAIIREIKDPLVPPLDSPQSTSSARPSYNPPPSQSGSVFGTIKDSLAATDKLNENEGLNTALLSGRDKMIGKVLEEFKAGMPITALVGVGRGSQEFIIEMDILEVIFYYGILGSIAMLWLYLLQGFKVVLDLFRNFSLFNLAASLALALCVGFLFLAGHTLFSVTGGFYFAFMIVYARMLCSKEGLDTVIL